MQRNKSRKSPKTKGNYFPDLKGPQTTKKYKDFFKRHCCHSVANLCPTLCTSMDCSILGFSILYYFTEFGQNSVH